MEKLAIKVVFGRKSTPEKSFTICPTYDSAIEFIEFWTSDPGNYTESPVFVKIDTETINKL